MRVGLMVGEGSGAAPELQGLIERGRLAERSGLDTAWIANIALDAMTASAALGAMTSRIEIGTAVVPTFTRHPVAMAQQATSTQMACSGRFSLGIGLAHKFMVEDMWGLSYEKPAHQMRVYLEILQPLMQGEAVTHKNEQFEEWLIETCTNPGLSASERETRLIDWINAPFARYCHPREEHLLPLHICMGMCESDAKLVFDGFVAGKKTSAFMWH